MAERAPAVGLAGGRSEMGTRPAVPEARRPPAAVPAAPPVPYAAGTAPSVAEAACWARPSVDGLRAHAHERIVRPQDAQPAADEQRRPAAAQPFGHLRPQAVVRQPVGLSWLGSPAVGLALRQPGDVVAAGPWPRLQLSAGTGSRTRSALDGNHVLRLILPADAGRAAASVAPIRICWRRCLPRSG